MSTDHDLQHLPTSGAPPVPYRGRLHVQPLTSRRKEVKHQGSG
jgi:hypothetical protein